MYHLFLQQSPNLSPRTKSSPPSPLHEWGGGMVYTAYKPLWDYIDLFLGNISLQICSHFQKP